MHCARRIVTLLLLALWLLAVLHCRLEAVGATVGVACCDETPGASTGDDCGRDACDTIEGEFASPSNTAIAVPAPLLFACPACPRDASALEVPFAVPPAGVSEAAAPPPEIIQSRHFLARSALPARAPDCVS